MSDEPRLTISFADEAGDGEAHWIRLEQVEMPDEGVTMAEAAELIDELYGIDACEDGLGNGGEEADEEELPEEEEFLELARERLELEICDDESAEATWETEVDVFRSHPKDGYSLRGERVTVGATTPMSKAVTETAEMNGASYDLQWPYGGGISVSAGEVLEVKGSTVNFKAPVKGRVRIRYTAVWDRVALKVGKGAADTGGPALAGVLVVSGGAAKTNSREEDNASVVAFWRDLAAECSLTRPPEDDQEIDAAEIERLCNRETDWHVAGECWQTIETYNLCNCSGEEAPDAPEPVDEDAPCPEGVRPGSWLGTVRRLGEYVDCEGEDKEGLNDPAFFREHCCEENAYSPLPRCRETREPHKGGKEIEHGPEHWKELYGESVRLTAVTPEEGNCGELVKVWAVPQVIEDPPELPEKIPVGANQNFSVTVLRGGRPPFEWIPPFGVTHLGDAAHGFMGLFRSSSEFKGGVLTLIDACGRVAECRLCRGCALLSAYDGTLEYWFDPPDQPYTCDPVGVCAALRSMGCFEEHSPDWFVGAFCHGLDTVNSIGCCPTREQLLAQQMERFDQRKYIPIFNYAISASGKYVIAFAVMGEEYEHTYVPDGNTFTREPSFLDSLPKKMIFAAEEANIFAANLSLAYSRYIFRNHQVTEDGFTFVESQFTVSAGDIVHKLYWRTQVTALVKLDCDD